MEHTLDEITKLLSEQTTEILEKNYQEELKNAKWKDGESNLDSHFAKIACEACEKAHTELKLTNKKCIYKQ